MSELKAYKNLECAFNTSSQQEIVVAEDGEGGSIVFEEGDEVYLKPEADKVIAYHKYKRCLAMVEMLEHICPITIRKAKWKGKWYMRWLELAEKFKEAK